MSFMFGPTRNKCIRLSMFDYATAGAYFVTVCVQERRCLFGEVRGAIMHLSTAGEMIRDAWCDLPRFDPRIQLDEFIVMPNHLHGIIVLDDTVSFRAGTRPAPTVSLIDIMRIFKSMTTVEYIRGVHQKGWPPFQKHLWQRGYYEHVVRDEADLHRIREYIQANPSNWEFDPENQP